MYNTVLFDLDGTLTDPSTGITNSVAFALKKWSIEVADKTTLYKFIGPPLKDSFMKYYGFCESDAELTVEYYREYFKDTGIFENRVYDGAERLLSDIKNSGREIILATSKPEVFARRILEHFGLTKYFDFIAGATMDSSRSKKADVIKYALEAFNVKELSSTVMVGDRDQDILGAKQNRLDSIGVLFGFGSKEELTNAGATHIAEKIEDILNYL